MDSCAGMSPSMETIAAGMTGFALASLISLVRRPQATKQDRPTPTSPSSPSHQLTRASSVGSSYTIPSPSTAFNVRYPGMGHDFHVLARLVAENQQHHQQHHQQSFDNSLSTNIGGGGAEKLQNGREMFKGVSFGWWAANNNTERAHPEGPEIVGLSTHVVFAAEAASAAASDQPQGQGRRSAMRPSEPMPEWATQSRGHQVHPADIKRELFEAYVDEQRQRREQRSRKCSRRDDEATAGSRWGWCRGRTNDASSVDRHQSWAPRRRDDDEHWGWVRFREEMR